jgi:hypothetical protein
VDERKYWIWITKPDYYLETDGSERIILQPDFKHQKGDWWTCHESTQKGDLILLYRTYPKCDIKYLIRATSNSYPISEDPFASVQKWTYGCDYEVLYSFESPLHISTIKADAHLEDWNARRANFWGKYFQMSKKHWQRITNILVGSNSDYSSIIESILNTPLSRRLLEEEIEDKVIENIKDLKRFGFKLALVEEGKIPELEISCQSIGRQCSCVAGRMDLLCIDSEGSFVVIEIKRDKAGEVHIAQLMRYMGYVKSKTDRPVRGILLASGESKHAKYAREFANGVSIIDISELFPDL